MRIGSLFSGTGALDMAVQAVLGGEVVWNVEYDAAPAKILEKHWPGVPNYGDVTTINWETVSPVEIVTAGYPCQPFSGAGKRKGSNDERHLWPYVLDAIRYLRPRVVVLENVRGHLSLGFDRVLGDLAEAGYDTEWVCLPASAAGAPHRRERIFIVAYPRGEGLEVGRGKRGHAQPELPSAQRGGSTAENSDRTTGDQRGLSAPGQAEGGWSWPDAGGRSGASAADASRDESERWGIRGDMGGASAQDESAGRERERVRDAIGDRGADDWGQFGPAIRRWEPIVGRHAPAATVPDGRGGKHRLSALFVEWMMGLPAGHVTDVGITRNEQLKALGNGVVPQQAALALSVLLPHSASEGIG